jgi:hypothetical protein
MRVMKMLSHILPALARAQHLKVLAHILTPRLRSIREIPAVRQIVLL